jgi:hypothetical protein
VQDGRDKFCASSAGWDGLLGANERLAGRILAHKERQGNVSLVRAAGEKKA